MSPLKMYRTSEVASIAVAFDLCAEDLRVASLVEGDLPFDRIRCFRLPQFDRKPITPWRLTRWLD